MFVKNSKNDLLTNKMISLWPFYLSTSSVPDLYKEQVNSKDGYHLLVLATDDDTQENGIYAWNGSSWAVFGQPNEDYHVPSGTSDDRPIDAPVGDLFFDTDDNTLQVYDGTHWLRGGGGAFPKRGNWASRPTSNIHGELYSDTTTKSLVMNLGNYFGSVACPERNGQPAISEGYYGGQMTFRVESGQLYIYTGTQWYSFQGTQVTE